MLIYSKICLTNEMINENSSARNSAFWLVQLLFICSFPNSYFILEVWKTTGESEDLPTCTFSYNQALVNLFWFFTNYTLLDSGLYSKICKRKHRGGEGKAFSYDFLLSPFLFWFCTDRYFLYILEETLIFV